MTEKVIYYNMDEKKPSFPFKFVEETFWTTQKIMASLFDVESSTIGYHLQEIFKSKELNEDLTTRKFRVVKNENGRDVSREIRFYNLDAIIAVGYRVNSKNATKFRQWATATLHNYIMTNLSESNNFKDMSEDEKRLAIRNEEIHQKKGLKKSHKILDFMGSTELAANLFRATQTDEKLRREGVKGKKNANQTHFEVGKKVRQTISEIGGTMPEDLPTPRISIKQIEQKQKKLDSK